MSKCKAVLDGDKITEIRVKTKAPGNQTRDKSKREVPSATQQSK